MGLKKKLKWTNYGKKLIQLKKNMRNNGVPQTRNLRTKIWTKREKKIQMAMQTSRKLCAN